MRMFILLLVFLFIFPFVCFAAPEFTIGSDLTIPFGALFVASEFLGKSRAFRSNGVAQLIFGIIKAVYSFVKKR